MHTHLDHSSLCLISSLLSHSSSHSRCLYAVLLSTSSIEFCRMHGWWSLLLPTCFPGERLVTWRHVIKSPLPKTSMDSLKFPIKSYLESQTNAFRLSPKVVEPWLLYEGTDLEAAIRHHVNHSTDDHDMNFELLPSQYPALTGPEFNVHEALNSAPINHLNKLYQNRATWRKEQMTEIEELAISLKSLQVDTSLPAPSSGPIASTSGSASELSLPQANLRPQRTKRPIERYGSESSTSAASPTKSSKLRQDFVLTANASTTRPPPSKPPCGHSVSPLNEQPSDSMVKQTSWYVMVGEVKRLHKLCTGDTKVCRQSMLMLALIRIPLMQCLFFFFRYIQSILFMCTAIAIMNCTTVSDSSFLSFSLTWH